MCACRRGSLVCLHMKSIFFKAHANDNWINRIHSTLLLALKSLNRPFATWTPHDAATHFHSIASLSLLRTTLDVLSVCRIHTYSSHVSIKVEIRPFNFKEFRGFQTLWTQNAFYFFVFVAVVVLTFSLPSWLCLRAPFLSVASNDIARTIRLLWFLCATVSIMYNWNLLNRLICKCLWCRVFCARISMCQFE